MRVRTIRAQSDGGRRTASGAFPVTDLAPLRVDVRRCDGVTIVKPRGDLDVATADVLHAALDGIAHPERLVLDLRGLSFIDSTGLHLLVALHQRAQRNGFRLTLIAPLAPLDKAIQLCGLDEALPFVDAADALHDEAGESARDQAGM
jgi:stage II sporulation protein AA (anti-sigma F factor antagonist)